MGKRTTTRFQKRMHYSSGKSKPVLIQKKKHTLKPRNQEGKPIETSFLGLKDNKFFAFVRESRYWTIFQILIFTWIFMRYFWGWSNK